MESINVLVVVAAITMIIGIVMFIKWYNRSKTKSKVEDVDYNDDYQDNTEELDDCCGDEGCVCHDTQAPVKSNMMRITSIAKVKVKTRVWLLTNGKSKQETDYILNNMSRSFDATGMDYASAPFKYEWTS